MKNTKVVNLGAVRDLMAEWDKVRQDILAQTVTGLQVSVMSKDGSEAIYLGGVYKDDPSRAVQATLKAAASRMVLQPLPVPATPTPPTACKCGANVVCALRAAD